MQVRELRIEYRPRPDQPHFDAGRRLENPRESVEFLRSLLEHQAVEVFGMICLSARHFPLCWHELARGTLDGALVHPREVFKVALLANAAALVLAHNHPSGDPLPSPEDYTLTARLVSAGQLLGVEVLDHIVIGHDGRYCSFRETGRL